MAGWKSGNQQHSRGQKQGVGSIRPWTGAKKIVSGGRAARHPRHRTDQVKRNWIQQKGVLVRALLGEGGGSGAETDQGGVKK